MGPPRLSVTEWRCPVRRGGACVAMTLRREAGGSRRGPLYFAVRLCLSEERFEHGEHEPRAGQCQQGPPAGKRAVDPHQASPRVRQPTRHLPSRWAPAPWSVRGGDSERGWRVRRQRWRAWGRSRFAQPFSPRLRRLFDLSRVPNRAADRPPPFDTQSGHDETERERKCGTRAALGSERWQIRPT